MTTTDELTREVQELRCELAAIRQAQGGKARGPRPRAWLGVPVILVAVWALSAQAPALSEDIEKRLSALESLIRKGPGNSTQVTGPFEVVGAAGAPILLVTDQRIGSATRLGRIHIGRGTADNFHVKVLKPSGHVAAQMAETNDGAGSFDVYDAQGQLRADLYGKNGLNVYGPGEKAVITLAPDPAGGNAGALTIMSLAGKVLVAMKAAQDGSAGAISVMNAAGESVARLSTVGNAGELVLSNEGGTRAASLGAKDGAGALSVMNSSGKAVAGLLGSGTAGGTIAVATSNGASVAEMTVSDDGRGVVQVRLRGGGAPVAVLSQAPDRIGGLVQISNASTPVANITVGAGGGGYFQLADPSGNPTVEAGTLPNGRGTVRAGPNYLCSPAQPATPVMTFGIPDCLVGNKK